MKVRNSSTTPRSPAVKIDQSRGFAGSLGFGKDTSPKHAAVPIIDDQNAIQRSAGMTILLVESTFQRHQGSPDFQRLRQT
jgi:hypothetical protein